MSQADVISFWLVRRSSLPFHTASSRRTTSALGALGNRPESMVLVSDPWMEVCIVIPVLDGVRDSFVTSSIVGLVVMIILFPAPASIAGYLESAEQQKMKAVRRLW